MLLAVQVASQVATLQNQHRTLCGEVESELNRAKAECSSALEAAQLRAEQQSRAQAAAIRRHEAQVPQHCCAIRCNACRSWQSQGNHDVRMQSDFAPLPYIVAEGASAWPSMLMQQSPARPLYNHMDMVRLAPVDPLNL